MGRISAGEGAGHARKGVCLEDGNRLAEGGWPHAVGLSDDALIRHIAHFTANLWQIHAFGEGNTRTTGVFIIKYLRTLGFDVQNDVFADNAWYFRNALVRANYSNIPQGIEETPRYLEIFFRNLLLGEQNVLQSRYLLIGGWQGGDDDPTSNPASSP